MKHIRYIFLFALLLNCSTLAAQTDSIAQPSTAMDDSIWKEYELEGVTIKAERIHHTSNGYKAMISSEPMYKSHHLLNALVTLPGLEIDRSIDGQRLKAFGEKISSVFVDGKIVQIDEDKICQYIRSLPAKEIVSVELVNPQLGSGRKGGDGYQLHIKTVSGRGGGMASFNLDVNDGNSDDLSFKPSITVLRTLNKFSYTAYVSYEPRWHMQREFNNVTDYYDINAQRREREIFDVKAHNVFDYMVGAGYAFSEQHSLSINLKGSYEDRARTSTTDNAFVRSDVETTTHGVTGLQWKDNKFQASVDYDGKVGNFGLNATVFGALRSQRSNNDMEKEGVDASSYFNIYRKTHNRSVGTINRVEWEINDKQKLTLYGAYAHWNNFIDSKRQMSGETDYLSYYKYKEDKLVGNVDFQQKLGNLTLTAGVGYTYLNTHFPDMPEYNNKETCILPTFTAKYIINAEKAQFIQFGYQHYIMQPRFDYQVPDTTWESEYESETGNPAMEISKFHRLTFAAKAFKFTFTASFNYTTGPTSHAYADDEGVINSIYSNGGKMQRTTLALYSPTIKPTKGWMITLNGTYTWIRDCLMTQTSCWNSFTTGITSMNELPYDFSLLFTANYRSRTRELFKLRSSEFMIYASLSRSFLKSKLNTSLTFTYDSDAYSAFFGSNYQQKHNQDYLYRVSLSLSYNIDWGKNVRRVEANRNEELNRL